MQRIYFLVPTIESTKAIVDDLMQARIEERHISVVAKKDAMVVDLPEASLTQKTDLIPALERGVAAGGLTGLLAGVLAVTFPPAGLALGGGALLGLTLFGTGFGAWVSSMVGVSLPNTQLKQFEDAIARGELLMLVDVPPERVEEIEKLVKRHHSECQIERA